MGLSPILDSGRGPEMMSTVRMLNEGFVHETGVSGSAPKRAQQLQRECRRGRGSRQRPVKGPGVLEQSLQKKATVKSEKNVAVEGQRVGMWHNTPSSAPRSRVPCRIEVSVVTSPEFLSIASSCPDLFNFFARVTTTAVNMVEVAPT